MIAALDDLPNDVGALKALVLHWAEQAAAKDAELTRVQDANARLWETLRQLRRAQFGRKSEKLDPDQLSLAMEETEQAIAEMGSTEETSNATLKASLAFDAVHRSTRYKSGVALRFPRINRIRWDKPAREADELAALAKWLD
jgi:ATP-dependent DNA ligase